MQASSGGLDVQLKILQALPFLVQNYAGDLKGNLLVTALNICFTLQSSKNAIVNNTSAATLQQLLVSVFDKVVAEDKAEGPDKDGSDGPQEIDMATRPAALDAYRIFNDVCLLTENQRPEFLRYSGLAQTFGLELIESVITNHSGVFLIHPEQVQILKVRVMPFINSALKGKPSFATSVRLVRLLYTLLRRHMNILPSECASALEILIQLLDQDTTLWRRALCMEVFRGILADPSLVRRLYALYDAQDSSKDVLKPLTASFVRLSTEKPAVIGLSHQSSMPISTPKNPMGTSSDQAMLEASGVPGVIPSSSENDNTGISTQWSTVRVPCIDQLDKTDPPVIPESYTYSLVLNCLSSLSDGLAKFILPLTVPNESRSRKRSMRQGGRDSPMPSQDGEDQSAKGMERMATFKKNPVPINPLSLQDHPLYADVQACSAIVEECWPAILATCSTFLYAALDTDYYHGLVRAFQRFAHVAGLLQLSTPRDAFLTTLGKAAVPPNVLTACLNAGGARSASVSTPSEASGMLSNARGLLSTDNLVPSSPNVDRGRQASFDAAAASLNTRNLLCLRALLNLGIALGPTLGSAWVIIFETLQQADFVLFTVGSQPSRTQSLNKIQENEGDGGSLMTNFSSEVGSVETAASRLIESTVDFPNEAFLEVVGAVLGLLQLPIDYDSIDADHTSNASLPPPSPSPHRRVGSFSQQPFSTGSVQEDQFALAKLGDLANVNIERLLAYPPKESGWDLLVNKLIETLDTGAAKPPVRIRAVEILANLIQECASSSTTIPEDVRGEIQVRLLTALNDARKGLYTHGKQVSVASSATVTDIHRIVLDSLKMVIESCGEALVSGWEVAFEIMGSVFVADDSNLDERRTSTASGIVSTRSPKLMRSAFASLQLVSSDFLSSLPKSCFLILVESLYNFSSQNNDLNIALTVSFKSQIMACIN